MRGQLYRRRKGRRRRGVFEKGEEIVFGPDGGLERDTGKDQEIVASALAYGGGGSPDWLLRPMDCLAGALRSGAAIADHMQARRPATISRLSAAPMCPDGGGMIELAPLLQADS
jgi:hypothetical protein